MSDSNECLAPQKWRGLDGRCNSCLNCTPEKFGDWPRPEEFTHDEIVEIQTLVRQAFTSRISMSDSIGRLEYLYAKNPDAYRRIGDEVRKDEREKALTFQ